MPITALPTPPSRQDPSNFSARADAFLGALPQFVTEANALESEYEAAAAAAATTAANAVLDSKLDDVNPNYTGTLTGGTGVINIGSGQIYKDASGNVGVGTSSVTAGTKLDVNGAVYSRGDIYVNGTSAFITDINGGYGLKIVGGGSGSVAVQANGSIKATFDAAGNFGLGVTPSAWGGYKAIELASVRGTHIAANASDYEVSIGQNCYFNGTNWVYSFSSGEPVTQYLVAREGFKWKVAPSGTAGNPISFTQAMTLDASGNLLVGATSYALSDRNGALIGTTAGAFTGMHATGTSSGAVYAQFTYAGPVIGTITQNGTTAVSYNTSSDYRLKNITGAVTNSGAYIDSLNPVEGTWKADGSTFVGLIAHEVQEASRTQVATGVKDGEEMQAMDYSSSELIANMIAELKSLRARVAQLESN